MPQAQLLQKIRTAVQLNNSETAIKLIVNSAEEKPNTETISNILKLAADYKRWDTVQQISQMDGENKPSQDAIDYTLDKLVHNAQHEKENGKYFEVLQFICEKTPKESISEKAINKTLQGAHAYSSPRWDFVKYLCALKDNKPTQPFIDGALKGAAHYKEWDTVQQISQMDGENKPSQDAIAYTLDKLVHNAQHEKENGKYFEVLQFICEKTPKESISEKAINKTLQGAHAYSSPRWDFVKYLCALKDNKPTQPFIDGALKGAAHYKEWDTVQQISQMDGENKPSQDAIAYTLDKLVHNAQHEKENGKYFEVLQFICEKTPKESISEKAINKTLQDAYSCNPPRWDFVKYLCALKDNKPTQPFIDSALQRAAGYGNLEIVQYICKLTNDRCPQADGIGTAFISAAQGNRINIIRFFWEKHTIKPSQEDIAKAFVRAASSGKLETVKYFLDSENSYQIDQKDITDALLTAVTAGALETVKYFLSSENNFQIDQKDIDGALLTAVTAENGLQITQFLLETSKKHLPGKEAIAQALNEAEAQKKLEIRDLLKQGYHNPLPQKEEKKQRHQQDIEHKKEKHSKPEEEQSVPRDFHQEFNKAICILQEKMKDFEKLPNFKTNPELQKAYSAANTLYVALGNEKDTFFANEPSHENYENFKLRCKQHIKDAREVLDQHRGLGKILLNIFAMIISAGVGYAIAAGINIAVKGRFTFFSTDSSEKLSEIEDHIENEDIPYTRL